METKVLAGIDVGTTGTKISLFDVSGQKLASSYREYELNHAAGGKVEIDPGVWWTAICEGMREILANSTVKAEQITGIGLSSTNALVLMDGEDRPLFPSIMQLDSRANGIAERIRSEVGEDWIFARTGNRVTAGTFWGPILLWLREHETEKFAQTRRFLPPHSYAVLKLTGEYTIDPSRASTTMLYNVHQGCWDSELCAYFGIKETDLPRIRKSFETAGQVTPQAAQLTGLRPGTPVVTGCMDSVAAHIGLGTEGNTASLILGTVGRIGVFTDKLDRRFMNTRYTDSSRFFCMSPVNGVGHSMKWMKKVVMDPDLAGACEDPYLKMNECADDSVIGSNGILFHPYLSGERSPIWDPYARGSFFGLTADHKAGDMIRSVMEGAGYALLHNLDIMREMDIAIDCFRAGGGGAASSLWLQILADILNTPVQVSGSLDSETQGAAVLAGVGAGYYPDTSAGNQLFFRKVREYEPNANAHRTYREYAALFQQFYERNADLYRKLSDIRNRNSG